MCFFLVPKVSYQQNDETAFQTVVFENPTLSQTCLTNSLSKPGKYSIHVLTWGNSKNGYLTLNWFFKRTSRSVRSICRLHIRNVFVGSINWTTASSPNVSWVDSSGVSPLWWCSIRMDVTAIVPLCPGRSLQVSSFIFNPFEPGSCQLMLFSLLAMNLEQPNSCVPLLVW